MLQGKIYLASDNWSPAHPLILKLDGVYLRFNCTPKND